MLKEVLNSIWNFSLKKGWDWIWSKTTIDEKVKAKIVEVKKEVSEVKSAVKEVKVAVKKAVKETKDVVKAVTPKKPSKPKASK